MLTAAPDSKWIQTVSGKAFWPLNPRVEDVCIEDIAHALSMKCRYTGHCRYFYSVAQHSVLASQIVAPQDAFWALLHDATEAYLPDVARPVKRNIVGFTEIEDRLMEVIADKFGLVMPMPNSIKHADLVLLRTERRDLMAPPPYQWVSTEAIEPMADKINALGPLSARLMFMKRFNELRRA